MKKVLFFFALVSCLSACRTLRAADTPLNSGTTATLDVSLPPGTTTPAAAPEVSTRQIRAIHLTGWVAGSPKYRRYLDELLAETRINALVIDIKEEEGWVYIPGIPMVESAHAYQQAIPDLADWLAALKKRGIYTIARMVVFKDNCLPRKYPAYGVKNPNGELWRDRHRITWIDPYNRDARRYNLLIALQASKMGFDEIQFDYIRFPTDGNTKQIRYSHPHSPQAASEALMDFLHQAVQLLHPMGVKVSVDVFGLTTSVTTGMGIGQLMGPMAKTVDYICPMVYPSHYYGGEYGIPVPNKEPYKIIHCSLRDALKMLGPEQAHKLRPYLQDFSLGVHYGTKEVQAQIRAAEELGVQSWTLWNARCKYTRSALIPKLQGDLTPNTTHSAQK